MRSSDIWRQLVVIVVMSHAIINATAITQTTEADVLNLNVIQDGGIATRVKSEVVEGPKKDTTVTESQENRSFFNPESDRRGGFFPSGPPGPGTAYGPNYHVSGNGFSYGAPSGSDIPVYGSNYLRPSSGHSYGITPSVTPPHSHAMAFKGLLLPIAGIALLGAAAVLAKSNPLLLQLGVVSGKRKRSIGDLKVFPANPYVKPQGF